jgi:HSP20 family protein
MIRRFVMASKDSKGLVKTEPSRALSPLEAIERRLAEMERALEDFFSRPFSPLGQARPPGTRRHEMGEINPSMDVYEEGDDVVVKAELPGMKKEDISVDFSDGTVIISGEKEQVERIERKNYHRVERSYGTFTRSTRMPVEVQANKAKATFKDGVLEIRVPKTEEAKKKGRKIPIE